MTVLVTGATGNVGAHVVHALLERGVPVRAFARDPEAAARRLGPGVEIAAGDFADRAALARAVRGADRLFLACANDPAQIGFECAAIDTAAAAGVRRVVKLSGPRPAADAPLVFERWHAAIEAHLGRSGLPSVLVRPAAFMTNVLAFAEPIARTGMLMAPAGTARIAYVDPRDVAAVAAVALAEDGHEGRVLAATGPEAVTYEQLARDLSAATGRQIAYVHVPDEAAREAMLGAGMPAGMADAIVTAYAGYRAGSMTRTTDTVRSVTGHEPRPFATFARDHASLFGAGGPRPQADDPAVTDSSTGTLPRIALEYGQR